MLRDFSLRDFGASLNTVESYTNESSQGKIGLYETVSKQKCTHLGMFLASDLVVDEDTSFSDGDFYTATEVYGKDNESYGFFDASGIYNIARFDWNELFHARDFSHE